ncbi:MAG TPA: T9SS type A sorting domain-containing protein [Ignavibacteriaceae bacterium]|nr:T9SS type A sorting domain-containing protein [Ignavibacteriaceae bacterium]
MKKLFYIILLGSLLVSTDYLNSQERFNYKNLSDIVIGSNFRIYPSNVSQSETFIVNHPNDPEILFASAYTIVTNPFFISEGVYVTTNSGVTWFGSDTCSGAPIQFHGGEPAIVIDKDGTFLLNRLGRQPTFIGLYSHYSTDNGITWSNQKTISTDDLEKHSLSSDINPLSSYYGRSYAVYTMLEPPYKVRMTYTNDGGQNWVLPFDVNNPPQRCFGTDIDINKTGEVLVCWAVMSAPPSPNEINIGFAKSENGGSNWTVQENPIQTNGITGVLSQKQNIRVNSTPRIAVDNSNSPYSGNIYIVTSQKELAPAGSDPDIVLFRSTDNGNTWSQGIRVNQDPLNNGKFQFFPAINIDPQGGINIIYLDDRNTSSDSSGIFLSRSTDGGNSWTDYEISDHNFRPTAVSGIGAGNISDHIDITYTNGKLWPVWMDNSTGVYQIWTAPITLSLVNVEDEKHLFSSFALNQNYPNPFNPSTKISWQSRTGSWHTLKVLDLLGREIVTLLDEYIPAGSYEIEFNSNDAGYRNKLTSGIYFYRLQTGEFSETKPMVLLK